jgi:intracellular sulfur oxidation DsrE/DsrF family protein
MWGVWCFAHAVFLSFCAVLGQLVIMRAFFSNPRSVFSFDGWRGHRCRHSASNRLKTSSATLLMWALVLLGMVWPLSRLHAQARFVQTPYAQPKALVDVYLDHPDKMGAALYWLRSLVNPLMDAPYSLLPEDMDIIVLLHGTELVTVANKNEARYADVVQRMRYYASQGVKFKVCGLALQDYGYRREDMQNFIEVTPSAITELVHWQNQGYALITPVVTDKKISIDAIR